MTGGQQEPLRSENLGGRTALPAVLIACNFSSSAYNFHCTDSITINMPSFLTSAHVLFCSTRTDTSTTMLHRRFSRFHVDSS